MQSFKEIVQVVKKLNSISRERLNLRRRLVLCTTLYRNPISEQLWWHVLQTSPLNFLCNFFEFFYAIFTQDAPLLFLYHGAKKVKNDPKLKLGEPALRQIIAYKPCQLQ